MGSPKTRDSVRELLQAEGNDTVVLGTNCLGRCAFSPNWVVYPEGVWYSGISSAVTPKLVTGHLLGGEVQSEYVTLRLEPADEKSEPTPS